MTGLGEDVYIDRSAALDELAAEGQRMGMYGGEPYKDGMLEAAARRIAESLFGTEDRIDLDGCSWLEIWDSPKHYADCCWQEWVPQARAALSAAPRTPEA